MSQTPDPIRAERDRFVAFAFAAADLLLEVDGAGKITFAAGALKSLTNRDAGALMGARSPSCSPIPTAPWSRCCSPR